MATAIRVISVIGSPRRTAFQRPPVELGLDFCFMDAATSVIDGVRVDEMQSYKHSGRLLVKGEIGCYCSHLLAWRELAASTRFTQMIVLEDDVFADWPAIRQIADVEWNEFGISYMKLLYKYPAKFAIKQWSYPIKDRHLVRFTTLALGTGAYLINRQAAEAFSRSFGVISRPIDVQMDRPWATGIPVFGIVPVCALELSVGSSIVAREAVRANVIPRWRYLRGRALEHAWARSYKVTSFSPRLAAKKAISRIVEILTNRRR